MIHRRAVHIIEKGVINIFPSKMKLLPGISNPMKGWRSTCIFRNVNNAFCGAVKSLMAIWDSKLINSAVMPRKSNDFNKKNLLISINL